MGRYGEIWGCRGDIGPGFDVGLGASPGARRRFWEMRLFLGDCVRSCDILRCRWRPHSPPCSGPRASADCSL